MFIRSAALQQHTQPDTFIVITYGHHVKFLAVLTGCMDLLIVYSEFELAPAPLAAVRRHHLARPHPAHRQLSPLPPPLRPWSPQRRPWHGCKCLARR